MIVTHLDADRLLGLSPSRFGGSSPGLEEEFQLEFLVNDPRGVICFEAFEAGRATEWSFWHDEFHVCLSGRASIEYTLAPNHRQVLHTEIGPNDALLILAGTRARFHVPKDAPYVHVSLFQPRYEYAKYLREDDFSKLERQVSESRSGGTTDGGS
ncbi:MAG TPA: hypothetical protein VGJ79_03475 [Candidatus Dormibacteraeota bacterium]|jgi:mannose-6-phosphate isomerase-like protein (cupin superfamily)